MARFQFFAGDRRLTDRRLTDGQNRLLNPASRMRARGKNHRLHGKWWSLIRIPVKAVWSASLPLTPYRGLLNRLSIAHCKALGESCLLSHKSSSWGVVGRSYGRQKKMANGTMKMVKASLKLWITA